MRDGQGLGKIEEAWIKTEGSHILKGRGVQKDAEQLNRVIMALTADTIKHGRKELIESYKKIYKNKGKCKMKP